MAVTAELWQAMLDHAKTEFPEIWTEERYVWCGVVYVCGVGGVFVCCVSGGCTGWVGVYM